MIEKTDRKSTKSSAKLAICTKLFRNKYKPLKDWRELEQFPKMPNKNINSKLRLFEKLNRTTIKG